MILKPYIVTNVAGPYVAGKRVKPGQKIELTDRQAKYELDRKTIEPAASATVHEGPKPAA
jgi:hypothetical protein